MLISTYLHTVAIFVKVTNKNCNCQSYTLAKTLTISFALRCDFPCTSLEQHIPPNGFIPQKLNISLAFSFACTRSSFPIHPLSISRFTSLSASPHSKKRTVLHSNNEGIHFELGHQSGGDLVKIGQLVVNFLLPVIFSVI